jgi:hypothetical protein
VLIDTMESGFQREANSDEQMMGRIPCNTIIQDWFIALQNLARCDFCNLTFSLLISGDIPRLHIPLGCCSKYIRFDRVDPGCQAFRHGVLLTTRCTWAE